MQGFLGGTLGFGMCRVRYSGVLACFALVTKACKQASTGSFLYGAPVKGDGGTCVASHCQSDKACHTSICQTLAP